MNGKREFHTTPDPECVRWPRQPARASTASLASLASAASLTALARAALLAVVYTVAILTPAAPVRAQEWPVPPAGAMRADNGQPPESMWEEDAEESLHLVPGTAHQLLTDEEWHQHREQMQTLDDEQRQRFMADWRKEIVARAHERGVPIPGERPAAVAPAPGGTPMAPEALGPDEPMEPPTRGAADAPHELEPAPDGKALPDPSGFPGD